MKMTAIAVALLGSLGTFAAGGEPSPLAIQRLGTRVVHKPSGESTSVELFMLTLGDTTKEDAKFGERPDNMFPFTMDSAQYAPDGTGAWRLYQFRWPNLNAGPDAEAFLAFLRRPDVKRLLEDIYTREDFGVPGDFIYKRMGVPAFELPAPFNRFPPAELAPIKSFYRYNADGTMNILLAEPYDEDARAHEVFENWKLLIENSRG